MRARALRRTQACWIKSLFQPAGALRARRGAAVLGLGCARACEKKVVAMSSSLPPTHGLPSERHSPSGALRGRRAAIALLRHAC
jgi:hypothetical protein